MPLLKLSDTALIALASLGLFTYRSSTLGNKKKTLHRLWDVLAGINLLFAIRKSVIFTWSFRSDDLAPGWNLLLHNFFFFSPRVDLQSTAGLRDRLDNLD